MSEQVFIERKPIKKKKRLRKQVIIFFAVFFILFLLLFVGYFFSDKNKVKAVQVIGNLLLSDEYIIDNCGIEIDDNLLMVNRFTVDYPQLIDKITIKKKDGIVYLQVEEKKIVGYNDDDLYILIDSEGKQVQIDPSHLKSLALLPYLDLSFGDLMPLICEKLAKLSDDSLFRIAEIHNISFTYDSNMLKLVMDEGYYVFSSIKGLPYLTNYLDILSADQNQNQKCILILEEYSKAIKTDCSLIDDYLSSSPQ